ncbi:unnamed protein product [marine sediment metagenome]|uniref:Uncharacterized protein n=1 Tax=marine sediment metagenome TaxID=412755 RepID=X0Z7B4_9ZZZZ
MPDEVRGPSQVMAQLSTQRDNAKNLMDTIAELEASLQGVLRDLTPSSIKEDGKKEVESLVPIASDIRGVNRDLKISINNLESIKDRLEL